MLAFRVLKAFSKTKINDVDVVLSAFSATNKEVVRLDITMNYTLLVHLLNSLIHLHSDMKYSTQVELSSALLEQVFQTLTELVHDHNVIHLAVFGLLITHKVQVGYKSLSS